MYSDIKFFPNLNSLRFFATLLVLVHHGEVIRAKNSFQAWNEYSFFQNGTNAVKFFFVLSGFLITYLLLKEKKETNKVNILSFYFKRVVRIWPLYFLLVVVGAVLLPYLFDVLQINYLFPYTINETWYFFLLFLPSLVTFKYGSHLLEPLWSIGVEEWFYIIWAPLFKWINKPLIFIGSIIFLKLFLLIAINADWITNSTVIHIIKTYSFEAMAIGGLGAYFLYKTNIDLHQLFTKFKIVNYLLLACTISYLLLGSQINPYLNKSMVSDIAFNSLFVNMLFLHSIIYCGVILSKENWLNNKWLNLGGEISYGIYMYHMLVIFMCIHFLKNTLLSLPGYLSFILFYCLVLAGTLVTAYISKKVFEDFFIKYKNKFDKRLAKKEL